MSTRWNQIAWLYFTVEQVNQLKYATDFDFEGHNSNQWLLWVTAVINYFGEHYQLEIACMYELYGLCMCAQSEHVTSGIHTTPKSSS